MQPSIWREAWKLHGQRNGARVPYSMHTVKVPSVSSKYGISEMGQILRQDSFLAAVSSRTFPDGPGGDSDESCMVGMHIAMTSGSGATMARYRETS